MTDLVHKAFAYAVSVREKVAETRILVATMAEALPVEKALKTVRSAFSERHYKDVPLARVDYGSDYILHDGKVKAEVIPDELRVANREAWSDMFRDAATQSFIVKDVNSGVDLAKMSERTDALALAMNAMSSLTGTAGILKEAPAEAFDILFCPGKPSTICFSATPSMRWSKMEQRQMLAPSSRRISGRSLGTSTRSGPK